MKKGYKKWLISCILIISLQSFSPSQAYIINLPTPQIQSDKEIYFIDDVIYINASWNFYASDNEDMGVKIILIDENPDALAISSIIYNSLFEIDLPKENGEHFFETEIDIGNLNLVESFEELDVWIILTTFTYNGMDPINSLAEKYEKIIKITKYVPDLYSNYTLFPIEYNLTTQIPNRVVALEKPELSYDGNVINLTLSLQDVFYYSGQLNLNETGDFVLDLSEYEINTVGIYSLEFDFRETHKFYSKQITYLLKIEESELEIKFLNESVCSVNMIDNELEITFQLKNTINQTIFLQNVSWGFNSNMNVISIEQSSKNYQIRVENPKSIGNYWIEVWGEIENYTIDVRNFSLNIALNPFNIVLNMPIYNNYNSLAFIVNVTSVTALNIDNLSLKINWRDHWLIINYNLTKFETNSTLSLELSWKDIQNLPNFTYVNFYTLYLEFSGNEKYSSTFSNSVNISYPLSANFYATPQIGSVGDPIQFYFTGNSENITDLLYIWEFGDGSNSTEKNPLHTFLLEGLYSISLNITDNQGKSDTLIQSSYILIYNDLKPSAIFSVNDSNIIEGQSVKFHFLGSLGNDPISIFWDFGDGNNSSVLEPSHLYNHNGSYSVSLSICDWDGDEERYYIENCVTVEKDIQSSANSSIIEPKSKFIPISLSLACTSLVGVIIYLRKAKIIKKSTKKIKGKKITV